MYIRKCKTKKARLLYFLSGLGNLIDGLVVLFTLGYATSSLCLYFSEKAMVIEIRAKRG
jgi:hypothetical protein